MAIRKHQKTVIRQEQIIDAARMLIINRGSEHIRIREIALKVGISEGAIYRHFKSKKDILSLLADRIESDLLGDITEAKVNNDSSLYILERVLDSHLSAIQQRRGVSFQVIAEIVSLGDKMLNKKISTTISKYIERIKEFLADGVKSGELRQDLDLDASATLYFGMIQGLVNIWALSNYSFNLEEKYEPLWYSFRNSIIRQ
jgi:AcrR family transcriptional regulator